MSLLYDIYLYLMIYSLLFPSHPSFLLPLSPFLPLTPFHRPSSIFSFCSPLPPLSLHASTSPPTPSPIPPSMALPSLLLHAPHLSLPLFLSTSLYHRHPSAPPCGSDYSTCIPLCEDLREPPASSKLTVAAATTVGKREYEEEEEEEQQEDKEEEEEDEEEKSRINDI